MKGAHILIKNDIEKLFTGKMNVYEFIPFINKETGITEFKEKLVYKDVSCRLSYKSLNSAVQGKSASFIRQEIKLITYCDKPIKSGSKIEVTQCGETKVYQKSGESAFYNTHQEIILSLFDNFA